ncbi:O-glycosyl hydrolase [Sphaerochaeta pleomorpha str. Grapes]|uniref:O-glycosyl hydrolase n=1 Tax=Sphaerochaeta pleomorpha (strain ATCC BAA-1885 / DSM 22778 / Grapes) TaxID=158190 RepID=G8QXC2_SPHPG|nr:glycoside hydrolase family 30 beta sandwich domain-containing protein [Sphaerochaeta pleomorpha]AEV28423.1 O-glycosyl hydrolase [Sphaerochaeta pleomorpha str. Grapes]
MKEYQLRSSNVACVWKETAGQETTSSYGVALNGQSYQGMLGFGGCFNELGYTALEKLDSGHRKNLMEELFKEASFNVCRLPIGANDYAKNWYSLDECPGDFDLKEFSIERDKQILIPYIKEALAVNKDMVLFASPWSPPTWLKNPPVYNWGKLIWEKQYLETYAQYFVRFVQEYAKAGVQVNQIHVQNEPVANQKFPSCMWTGEELKVFIRDYLGPAFREAGIDSEIWLGTINAPGCDYRKLLFDKWAEEDYDYFANTVLSDPKALSFISGVSYQWGGKIAIQRTFESWWPRIRLMQSENECGFADNTWDYAFYTWTMLKHYLTNGAESYLYWNIVLEEGGFSTWGDPQNSMVTVHQDGTYTLNPDYYIMKHFSSIIQRGAVRLGLTGPWAADTLIFCNPDGSYAVELFNPFETEKEVVVQLDGKSIAFTLPGRSVSSVVL